MARRRGRVKYLKVVFFALVVLGFFVSQFFRDVTSYFSPEVIEGWFEAAGPWAPVLYMLTMAAAVVVSPVPSLPLNIAAGAFFGPFAGTVYSLFGALGGAAASFMIARLLGREFVERFLGGHVNFCPRCSDRLLTRIVFVSRLIPVVSFDLVSYGAGLTAMSLWKFCLATFLGMIPLTAVYNYTGAALMFDRGLVLAAGLVMVVLFFALPRWLEKKNLLSFGEAKRHCDNGPVKAKPGA
jgi:uncharacterized membrane protein YdjX (TVP38/TMEM64 family)